MEAPPSPDYIPGPEAPPSPDYIPRPEAPPSPDYIPGLEYPEYLLPADDVLPAEEQPLHAAVSPTAESPGYITKSEPEMEPEKDDGDDKKSEGDSIGYLTSRGDDDADIDGDDLLEDDADDEDEEESSDKLFKEGETAATPPPFGYRIAARISIQPHILMPFRSDKSIPEADIPIRKRGRFTTPTSRYEIGERSVATAARQIRPALTRNSVVNGDTSNTTGTGPRIVRPTRECTYKDYLNYGPLKFNGTEGVIGLTRWVEIKKLDVELWNLKVKGTDITIYNLSFQELTLLCGRMFHEESDEIERYVGRLPEMIQRNVMSYEPKSMQKAIESANHQMDQKLLGITDLQADNKRKFDNTSRNQQN
nr:reverse transcriptase domain-containing protein [Tanacetum cinerariifolium]